MKSHLKRISSPKSWPIARKGSTFIKRPYPGKIFMYSISLNLALKKLGFAKNAKEVRSILNNQEVLVDGKRFKEEKALVGLMDVLTLPLIKKSFRLVLNNKAKLEFIEIDEKEAKIKPCKIIGKTLVKKGKLQLNTLDSRSILVDKDEYGVGDTVMIDLPSQKIQDSFKLEVGSEVYLIKGHYVSTVGKVKNIEGKMIFVESNGNLIHTLKDYAYVVGKGKPAIKLS